MYNKVMLIGNVGGEPEVRKLGSGATVATFSLATTSRYKKGDETLEQTQWHRIVIWNKLAEIAEKYVKKGSQVFISGEINYREWTDDNGVKKYATDIIANELKLLGKKEGTATDRVAQQYEDRANSAVSPQQHDGAPTVEDDDLPF